MPFDRVRETSTTTGTGPLTLAGAPTGFRAFASVYTPGDGDPVHYVIEGVDGNGVQTGEWEVGVGEIAIDGTFVRSLCVASSNGGAHVDFSAGTKRVFDGATVGAVDAKVATHAADSDPHGDRAYVDEVHAQAEDPHGDRAYFDGIARPGVTALGSDTIVVDILGTRLQTRTATTAVTLDAYDYTADREVVVVVTNGSAGVLAVTAVSPWVWLTDEPTTLAAGERGVLSLLSTTAVEGGTFAAWAVEA
jgi:hypothetical protein